jgi:hypothetical protein
VKADCLPSTVTTIWVADVTVEYIFNKRGLCVDEA